MLYRSANLSAQDETMVRTASDGASDYNTVRSAMLKLWPTGRRPHPRQRRGHGYMVGLGEDGSPEAEGSAEDEDHSGFDPDEVYLADDHDELEDTGFSDDTIEEDEVWEALALQRSPL